MQSLHGKGPGGCSSEKLKQLNHNIDTIVTEVSLYIDKREHKLLCSCSVVIIISGIVAALR